MCGGNAFITSSVWTMFNFPHYGTLIKDLLHLKDKLGYNYSAIHKQSSFQNLYRLSLIKTLGWSVVWYGDTSHVQDYIKNVTTMNCIF